MSFITKKDIAETYIYGYPVMGMYELLYDQVLGENKSTDFNQFLHMTQVPTPQTSFVPAPNNDTTYSCAWLDLTKGPVVITVPDTHDRYYSIQFWDMFSETIRNVGKRTTGTAESIFCVVGPDCKDPLPADAILIRSDTLYALAILRILIYDEHDLGAVKELQQKVQISRPCCENKKNCSCQENYFPPLEKSYDNEYFETLSKFLSLALMSEDNKLHKAQAEIISLLPPAKLKKGWDAARVQIEESGMQFGEDINHWRIARKKIGNFGTDYLQRAAVWHKGALADQPEESLYLSTYQDSDGAFLDGRNEYELAFPKGALPPVSQFWSLTMYRYRDAFLIENPINRYSIGDRTNDIVYQDDGSLTLFISQAQPSEKDACKNWLPAPAERFYMTMRLYGPGQKAINGEWVPPAVVLKSKCGKSGSL